MNKTAVKKNVRTIEIALATGFLWVTTAIEPITQSAANM